MWVIFSFSCPEIDAVFGGDFMDKHLEDTVRTILPQVAWRAGSFPYLKRAFSISESFSATQILYEGAGSLCHLSRRNPLGSFEGESTKRPSCARPSISLCSLT